MKGMVLLLVALVILQIVLACDAAQGKREEALVNAGAVQMEVTEAQAMTYAASFASAMGIDAQEYICRAPVPLTCSAVLLDRPVVFECADGCTWATLPELSEE